MNGAPAPQEIEVLGSFHVEAWRDLGICPWHDGPCPVGERDPRYEYTGPPPIGWVNPER